MVEPSPCPRCGGVRAWKATGPEAATIPVLCGACGREASACPRCGWEWTGLPRNARAEHRIHCVSCRVLRISNDREMVGRGGQVEQPHNPSVPSAFASRSSRSRLLQRLADAGEADGEKRYRACRAFAEAVAEASRRAEVIARLEAGLRRLPAPVR